MEIHKIDPEVFSKQEKANSMDVVDHFCKIQKGIISLG